MKVIDELKALKAYCEKENFAGWDPYDGLNSKVFKTLPLVGRSAIVRLVWIQLFKRNPLNLRRLLLVPKQRNAKGIGLFLTGYCALWRAVDADPALAENFGLKGDIEIRIRELADWLIANVSPGKSGAAWGYNFPWQCRREFLFPAYEPTVVATYFCARALFDAHEITCDSRYRDVALTSAEFVKNDLRRTPYKGGILFSYSGMPGNDTIYNASLLGSALLARCYALTGIREYYELARLSVDACCAAQGSDGSWTYGVKPVTDWIDSFHTGYNLMALQDFMHYTDDDCCRDNIRRGLKFYIDNFFLEDGAPKYYHNSQYPIDIHCVGQLFVTLVSLRQTAPHADLIRRVAEWAEANMLDRKGFYYYQLKKNISSKISYMRWSNAFMFASLSLLVESRSDDMIG